MSFQEIVDQLIEKISDEGVIENETSSLLFSSFNDPNVWSKMNLLCAMPNSSFYIAKIDSKLTPTKVDSGNHDNEAYLIVRYTKDDIGKYINYLKFEYQSYIKMQELKNEIIAPIGFIQREDGFLFAFVSSTNLTLNDVINDIRMIPHDKKFSYTIKLVDNVIESLNNGCSGFHFSSRTILINKKEKSIGLIGFIGEQKDLQLCQAGDHFLYDIEFSARELKKKRTFTLRAPNSFSDVFGLAKITEFIIGEDLRITSYQEAITFATQDNQNDRLSLNDFKKKIVETQKSLFQEEQQNPLVDKILKISTPVKEKGDECIFKYKLPQKEVKKNPAQNLRRVIVGPEPTETREEIRILVVGKTGSGKTTFINGMVNFLYRVNFTDKSRFLIVSDEDEGQRGSGKNQAESQTDDVTAYTIYWQPDFPISNSITLIDTPGFGDTRGIEKDKEIVNRIHSFFDNHRDFGVEYLNAIAFVAKASDNRFNPYEKYVYNEIMKLFAKDLGKNIIIVLTHDNGNSTEILNSFKKVSIQTTFVNKFDNKALFMNPKGQNTDVNKSLWKNSFENFKKFFENVYKMTPGSISLSQKVLLQRRSLANLIENLNNRVQDGLSQLNVIKEKLKVMKSNEQKLIDNQDFEEKVPKTGYYPENLPKGEYVTNCPKCQKSCHYPCYIKLDKDKYQCSVMDSTGKCEICGCHWSDHQNNPYRYVYKTTYITVTKETMKKDFNQANQAKPNIDRMFDDALNQYVSIWENCSRLITECKDRINQLNQIAMKPNLMSSKDYIEYLIRNEENARKPDYLSRISFYKMLIKQLEKVDKISKDEKVENIMGQPDDQEIKQYLNRKIGKTIFA